MNERIIINGYGKSKTASLVVGIILILISAVFILVGFFPYYAIGKIVIGVICLLISICFFVLYSKSGKPIMTVTNMRITGADASGSRVDLPIDRVVSASLTPEGIKVCTYSKENIIFTNKVRNSSEVLDAINKLIVGYQGVGQQSVQPQMQQPVQPQVQQPMQPQIQPPEQPQIQQPVQQAPRSIADELMKFKELMDNGVITQQEFEEKKRQLLGKK